MGALDGIQIIDLTTGMAGPLAGMHLGDQGADVVKVETPQGDPARSTRGFVMWNRGKRGIVADPDRTADRERVAALIRGADVLLINTDENLAVYGLDREQLLTRHRSLVLTSMPPYEGPAPWSGGAESNGLLSAYIGLSWRQVSYDGGPVEPVVGILLHVHAAWAAACTAAALVAREETGFGQAVTVTGAQDRKSTRLNSSHT